MIADEIRRELDAVKKRVADIEAQIAEHGPLERRLRSHVDDKNDDFKLAVEERIKFAIRSEMSAVTSALRPIEEYMRAQNDRDKVRAEQEQRDRKIRADTQNEMVAEDLRIAARVAEALAERKMGAEIGAVHIESKAKVEDLPNGINGTRIQRNVYLKLALGLIVALLGSGIWSALSHH